MARTDASGAWHVAATLQDRYGVTVGVSAKTINFKRDTRCGPARAEMSVGPPDPPGTTY